MNKKLKRRMNGDFYLLLKTLVMVNICLLIASCSLTPQPDKVFHAYLTEQSKIEGSKNETTHSFHAILHTEVLFYENLHSLSAHNYTIEKLNNYPNTNTKRLWRHKNKQFDLTINYDHSLTACAEQLKKTELEKYFPADYLIAGGEHIPLHITLTQENNFSFLHTIDRKKPELKFVFRYLCNQSEPDQFFAKMVRTIYHETTHFFQNVDSSAYASYSPDKWGPREQLLWETVASIHDNCALLLAPAFSAFSITSVIPERINMADYSGSDFVVSGFGKVFAISWLHDFTDHAGNISRDNNEQYKKLAAVCRSNEHEIIRQAAAAIAKHLVEPEAQNARPHTSKRPQANPF